VHITDTHCHLDHTAFDTDRAEILHRCQALAIKTIIVPGVLREGWDKLLTLCSQYDALVPALGLHPMFVTHHQTSHLDDLALYAKQHNLVAVGEIGLDFYHGPLNRDVQLRLFQSQLDIASQANLPVILHVRKAHDLTLKTLRNNFSQGGIVHAFNGSLQQAEQYIALGFKLGFGGMLTYSRANKLRLLALKLPLDAIVLETDAPDMVVANHKGERNSPEYIIDSLSALAQIRQLTSKEIARITSLNAQRVLRLTEEKVKE